MADHDHRGAILPLTYYPAFCHKVSPTFFTWVKMAAVDVHRQNLYFYLNHPIQFICAAGIIVARDEQEHRSILVLDDSSGACLEIVCSKSVQVPNTSTTTTDKINDVTPIPPTHLTSTTQKPLNITPLLPGARAKLKGTISCFRGMFQLHLERYEILPDTNAEVRFWDERTRFRVQVLSMPWVVAHEEVEKLKGEAEGAAGAMAAQKGGGKSSDGKSLNMDGYVVARRRKAERGRERERERERRRVEREEKDRLRIQRRYEREEVVREKLARRCREKSALVNEKGKKGTWDRRDDV
ncbi:hypothetical protein AJ78_05692 [Emergomyces pasteurianus Ep9510]|uniref:CST complex subunit Stn1 N-terminal domain-containing protein n=1 Tax=Emergomyces pasteurianus Ep9510 TaxID=1447872 RepID=A0A1J9PCZ1_9EURO|nr:hypothetical protein AJ78_05692 [Emergomyces pasteurianus Ep9510]